MSLNSLYRIFASHKEGAWIMEDINTHKLYQFVKEHDVKRILDLGTGIGCSAAVVALALKDKGIMDYHIDSVDQFDKCLNLAKELIPSEFQEHMTFHKSEAVIWQTDKIPYQYFSIYETLPEGEWDLIINDGPSPFMLNEAYIELPNATVTKMLLEDKLKPGCYIAWDGRIPALHLLERYFYDNFWLAKPALGSDLRVIERKNNPLSLKDERYERIRDLTTYFK